MNYLIIFAHPNGKSFSHQILKTLTEEISSSGNSYEYRNLYDLNFEPVLSSSDLAQYKKGEYPDDVRTEQQWVSWADVLVFIYPLWWGGMPAIMKGYIDRVYATGFAYEFNDNNPVGLLQGKKALLLSTQGYSRDYYDSIGMTDAMLKIETSGIFGFCGIELLEHLFFGNAPAKDTQNESEFLKGIRNMFAVSLN